MALLHFRPNLEKININQAFRQKAFEITISENQLGLVETLLHDYNSNTHSPKKKKDLIIFMSENKLYVCTRVELIKKMYKNHIQKSYELKTKQQFNIIQNIIKN